jgi:hypothetical protein
MFQDNEKKREEILQVIYEALSCPSSMVNNARGRDHAYEIVRRIEGIASNQAIIFRNAHEQGTSHKIPTTIVCPCQVTAPKCCCNKPTNNQCHCNTVPPLCPKPNRKVYLEFDIPLDSYYYTDDRLFNEIKGRYHYTLSTRQVFPQAKKLKKTPKK